MSAQRLLDIAAHKGMAEELIRKLANGYDQMLGRRFEGGVDLSGGEWQKFALSRAYFRDAQVLILDEPTAALDALAEYEIFRRFAELTEGKLAVLISHLFSTVRMADRIVVLGGGVIREQGTHEQLLARDATEIGSEVVNPTTACVLELQMARPGEGQCLCQGGGQRQLLLQLAGLVGEARRIEEAVRRTGGSVDHEGEEGMRLPGPMIAPRG